ncbi:hypothetical protein L6Q21_06615 [Sandaracinobacter sp. RS1-74]|uniref:hypothetical protein n=1 Tax=Sandaracinobacteroides sayramensis TaxID=2913411 RepID=UPI001EDB2C1F|nr:hypothetical protein [Sandaracinobacteroides sayramensis]MCG2840646.1 hypothetical protein [Sandaracinobacteroides sayramensis]
MALLFGCQQAEAADDGVGFGRSAPRALLLAVMDKEAGRPATDRNRLFLQRHEAVQAATKVREAPAGAPSTRIRE